MLSNYLLHRHDEEPDESIAVPIGIISIGRGKFLKCKEKKVSRNHGLLEVLPNGEIFITSTHVSLLYVKGCREDSLRPLPRNTRRQLYPGDLFSLLPDAYQFRLVKSSTVDVTANVGDVTGQEIGGDDAKKTEKVEDGYAGPTQVDEKTLLSASGVGQGARERDQHDELRDNSEVNKENAGCATAGSACTTNGVATAVDKYPAKAAAGVPVEGRTQSATQPASPKAAGSAILRRGRRLPAWLTQTTTTAAGSATKRRTTGTTSGHTPAAKRRPGGHAPASGHSTGKTGGVETETAGTAEATSASTAEQGKLDTGGDAVTSVSKGGTTSLPTSKPLLVGKGGTTSSPSGKSPAGRHGTTSPRAAARMSHRLSESESSDSEQVARAAPAQTASASGLTTAASAAPPPATSPPPASAPGTSAPAASAPSGSAHPAAAAPSASVRATPAPSAPLRVTPAPSAPLRATPAPSKPAAPQRKLAAMSDSDDSGDGATGTASGSQRESCGFGAQCYRKNPEHQRDFAHPGDADFTAPPDPDQKPLPECEFGLTCYRKNPQHWQEFRHSVAAPNPGRQAKRNAQKKARQRRGNTPTSSDEAFIDSDSDEFAPAGSESDSDTDWADAAESDEEDRKRARKEARRLARK